MMLACVERFKFISFSEAFLVPVSRIISIGFIICQAAFKKGNAAFFAMIQGNRLRLAKP